MVHLAKGSNSEALQMKVVTYFRVSTSKQGVSGLGLEAQKQAVDSYLHGKSATVVKSFTEIGSGKRDDNPNISAIRNTDLQAANAARIQQASKRNADIRSVIREIVTESPYKLSSRGIAEKLNDAGYVTLTGKPFSHVAVIRAQGKKAA